MIVEAPPIEENAELAAIVGRAEELAYDVDFASVKAWKDADSTRKAVGFLPIYAPREVIHACGAMPVGIIGGADRLEVVRGDSYFQSYICHLPRSVIEMQVTGRLDEVDGFIFPSICDVIRNLSGMFKVLAEDRFIHYLDLPQNFDAELGGRFYRSEIELVAKGISELTGVELTDENLRNSIELYNANRRVIRKLLEARSAEPWRVSAVSVYLLLRAGYVLPVEEHTKMIADYLDLAFKVPTHALDNIRVLIRGAFCEQPPIGLLRTLERAGCYIVNDDLMLGARFIPGDIPIDDDPIGALVTAFMHSSLPTASKYDHCHTKAADLIADVKDSRADGVILMAPSFCDPALLDQPMLQKALDDAHIPYTEVKYSEDTGQFQVIREQAGTFADAIKLWGEV